MIHSRSELHAVHVFIHEEFSQHKMDRYIQQKNPE
ncbi:hypothetical protein SLEP1_g4520 [Rubroshorea leprosula]|uniref:Uncharacterized protein n=1 Tax=Rubroshorea leprosula TaxID=152421 RepID=A0AAV5HZR2_9ROSI|nr:hypothetical protein SLEP1_g4520 [Rubroshorea leprosula]